MAVGTDLLANVPVSFHGQRVRFRRPDHRDQVLPAMFVTARNSGDVHGSSVTFDLFLSLNNGDAVRTSIVVEGKCTAPYIREQEILLPHSDNPSTDFWELQVVRTTDDAKSVETQNACSLDYVSRLNLAKYRYHNTSLIAMQLDAQQFGSIPTRMFHLKGIKVQIPSNYFPLTRKYTRDPETGDDTGEVQPWDGTFYVAWSDNPAWCYYDLATNKRYGLGQYLTNGVDKWTLYQCAQYCDELIPSTDSGNQEPRFTCNLYMQTQEDAVKVMNDMANIFRAMVYWAGGTILIAQDSPKDPIKIFTNTDVFNGDFTYTGTAKKARHTAASVRWNDPFEFFQPKF